MNKLKSERFLPQFIHFCFCIVLMYLTCVILCIYTPYLSPQSSGMSHRQTSTNVLGIFPGQGEIWICILKTSQNSQLLWCPDFFTPTSVSLWVSLGPWSYLHLINWVEAEIGLWRRISNTWSSSLFFVFQMHDICKSLISSCTCDRSFASSIYTNTLSHIISWW